MPLTASAAVARASSEQDMRPPESQN
jgi:hypothetical protein